MTALAAPPTLRIAFIDNARFWVMLMVVIAHPLFHFITLDSGRALYYWLNLVMMPAFAMLSGYISRNFSGTPKEIQRTVSTLVIPYLLVETTYQVLQRHYTGAVRTPTCSCRPNGSPGSWPHCSCGV